jgi:hypothetical protein
VVCYTNHALDQFLEELLDIGIPESSIVRLGGKSTARTEPLSLFKVDHQSHFKFRREDWKIIDRYKLQLLECEKALATAADRFQNTAIKNSNILEHLEFEAEDFFAAFTVPKASDGTRHVMRRGKAVPDDYLYCQWLNGWNAGIFRDAENVKAASEIWQMPRVARNAKIAEWRDNLLKEQVLTIHEHAKEYNHCIDLLEQKFEERNRAIIASKRIIGCTTTAAAKYREGINAASPDVLLVEEAGEILESHILTALGSETQQLILIGDHKYALLQ